eukprot:3671095-Rhodomonas_salina.5
MDGDWTRKGLGLDRHVTWEGVQVTPGDAKPGFTVQDSAQTAPSLEGEIRSCRSCSMPLFPMGPFRMVSTHVQVRV